MKIAKIPKLAALLLCLALFAGMMAACNGDKDENGKSENGNGGAASEGVSGDSFALPGDFSGIDFSNGNTGFLMMHYKPFDSSPDAALELSEFKGAPAARITPVGTAVPYIAIDACSLLGDRIKDVASAEVYMGAQHPDGSFQAVAGEIIAVYGTDRLESKDPWSVFVESRNPNIARAELDSDKRMVSGAYNMFIIRRVDDSGIVMIDGEYIRGTASNLYIMGIGFKDDAGNWLPVNADAGFNAPDKFNQSSRREVELGVEMGLDFGGMNCANSSNPNNQVGWLTDGTDNTDSPYSIEDMAYAQQLVLEFAAPPRGKLEIIWLGSGNGWRWQQAEVIPDGGTDKNELTINLTQVFSDFDLAKHEDYDGDSIPQVKLLLAYFSYSIECPNCDDAECDECGNDGRVSFDQTIQDLQITRAYLVIHE
ncbi:MAG: hypothetical protein FWE74_06260 [Oscillospiraceae bacterium]|nr:hypothetical protein [Oscillospiraceae bacterium]